MEDFNNRKYIVCVDDEVVAKQMSLKDACILLRALFEEYYNDRQIRITIREEGSLDCHAYGSVHCGTCKWFQTQNHGCRIRHCTEDAFACSEYEEK